MSPSAVKMRIRQAVKCECKLLVLFAWHHITTPYSVQFEVHSFTFNSRLKAHAVEYN